MQNKKPHHKGETSYREESITNCVVNILKYIYYSIKFVIYYIICNYRVFIN